MRILVVDDAIVARKMIKRHLADTPFGNADIVEATSAEQGLQLLDESIDVVMSDWNMPGMDGIQFVQEVGARSQTKPVPIIMITTEGTAKKINQAKEAGVDEYITKPFSSEQLMDSLSKVLEV